MERNTARGAIENQGYRPRNIPTLREVNALSDEKFRRYIRRGCLPEPTDLLFALAENERLTETVTDLSARVVTLERAPQPAPHNQDARDRSPRGLNVEPR